MKALVLFMFASIVTCSMAADSKEDLYWKKDYKIRVSDFMVVKILPKNELASINTGIHMKPEGKLFRAYAVCNRRSSYMCEKVSSGYRLKEVLNHEQGHFDITEVVARMLNNKLINVTDSKSSQKLYQYYVDKLETIQLVYDAQTEHSNDSIWQKKWDDKLLVLLSGNPIGESDWKMYP